MVTEYKVIKQFSCAEIGDVFTWDEEDGVYECTSGHNTDNFYSSKYISINEEVAKQYAKSGLIEAVKTPDLINEDKRHSETIRQIAQEIARLKNTYIQRKETVDKKYESGKMPTCQKVEHDTVYFNLMKVLNKFESIINE